MKVEFTDHALERADERLPHLGYRAIAREIDDAIFEGRISRQPPSWRMRNVGGCGPKQDGWVEFAWPADRSRVYVLSNRSEGYVVLVSIVLGIRAAA